MEYRQLDEKEIRQLEDNNCWAEDWQRVMVADDFNPNAVRNVTFYGNVKLGSFDKSIEVSKTFMRRTGVYNATLRNVTIGNNSLVENVGNYINNYVIGSDCYISNICTMETTEGATYGEGNIISVLNEVGEGNVVSYHGLTSQIAALMVRHAGNNAFRTAIRRLVAEYIQRTTPDTGTIGNGVKIVNTKEVTNTVVYNDCEINGAARISDCTIMSSPEASVFIGTGVICENSIIAHGSSIINSVKMQDCFVGEACKLSNGFTAAQSVFFANSYMSNGEACAAFCGPFSSSHHKSSLIIGGMFSFYNAGSATNFSNHAYKMGPIHYGTLERGSKTASGAYLLMPAHIGTFSVCFGKLMYHPDTRSLPFSYLIAYGDIMYLVPGRNLTTVGLYRDIRKWPKRDMRSKQSRKSIVNFDWLSPFSVGEIIQGKKILERLREASGENVSTYNYHEYVIKTSSLRKGIKYYDIALRIFMGAVLKRHALVPPVSTVGTGKWNDLSGLLLPDSEEQQLVSDIADGTIESMDDIVDRLNAINDNYNEYRWAWAYRMILDYYGLSEITQQDAERIHTDYITARRAWIAEIKKDAEKEYQLGDVEDSVLQNFVSQLDKEIDFENMTLYK
ncbi:MAG: DUF4954 family protein [Prevotella sp.]|nr:DUF4954 family protein [Prevotella sp.]